MEALRPHNLTSPGFVSHTPQLPSGAPHWVAYVFVFAGMWTPGDHAPGVHMNVNTRNSAKIRKQGPDTIGEASPRRLGITTGYRMHTRSNKKIVCGRGGAGSCFGNKGTTEHVTQLSHMIFCDSRVVCKNKWSLEVEIWIQSWCTQLCQQSRHCTARAEFLY